MPFTHVQPFADIRVDHVLLTTRISTAAQGSITDYHTFASHARDTLFSRVCYALDNDGIQRQY